MSQTAFDVLRRLNWDRFFTIVEAVGPTLDDRKGRFDKSDIFENALGVCSGNAINWVDGIGLDHIVLDVGDCDLEMKSAKNSLFTKTGRFKKNVTLKLMNSLGNASNRTKEDVVRFDNLLIIDTGDKKSFSAALVSANNIKPEYLDFKEDGVILKIPTQELQFIVRPNNLTIGRTQPKFSYQERKKAMQREFIESF